MACGVFWDLKRERDFLQLLVPKGWVERNGINHFGVTLPRPWVLHWVNATFFGIDLFPGHNI